MPTDDFILNFSDPRKTETVTVPGSSPNINVFDTSLALIGKGYPDYARKLAQNFLYLLENFSGPNPPQNPIEGQLWYDTSDPDKKVLRIMDSTLGSQWTSASGIFQQGTDPNLTSTKVKVGDIWVDTSNNILKIFNSNEWVTVGPSSGGSSVTGVQFTQLMDSANNPHWVTMIMANGQIISIISQETFVLRGGNLGSGVSLDGFYRIVPGINLPTRNGIEAAPVFNGTAESSKSLISSDGLTTYRTERFLRKDDLSINGQVITGNLVFKTSRTAGEGSNGIVIKNDTSVSSSNFIQFYKDYDDAIVVNNSQTGRVTFKIRGVQSLEEIMTLSNSTVNVKKPTTIKSLAVEEELVVVNPSTFRILGGSIVAATSATFSGNVVVGGTLVNTGQLSVGGSIVPSNTGVYDVGSSSKGIRDIYLTGEIKSPTGSSITFKGNITGTAGRLEHSTTIQAQGQVESTSGINFNGSGSVETLSLRLTSSAISEQTALSSSNSSLQLMVLDTSTSQLHKIDRDVLIGDVFSPGMIMPFGGAVLPSGWVVCNGTSYDMALQPRLYGVIGLTYGGNQNAGTFNVPNMTTSTYVTTGTNTGTYISYMIKL